MGACCSRCLAKERAGGVPLRNISVKFDKHGVPIQNRMPANVGTRNPYYLSTNQQQTTVLAAIQAYNGQQQDELSFNAGDTFIHMNQRPPENDRIWVTCQRTGRQGLAPISHLLPMAPSDSGANGAPPGECDTAIQAGSAIGGREDILVAIHAHQSACAQDLSCQKGDRFQVLDPSDSSGGWYKVKSLTTSAEGYLPACCLVRAEDPWQYDWFRPKMTREEAMHALLANGNHPGCFLIRESENTPGAFTVAVLIEDTAQKKTVTNVRIRNTSKEHLHEFVDFHKVSDEVIGCRLTTPCPREPPVLPSLSSQTRDWHVQWEDLKITSLSPSSSSAMASGSGPSVWPGVWRDVVPVAITLCSPQAVDISELRMAAPGLSKLRHANLVTLYGICMSETVATVTELLDWRFLRAFLVDKPLPIEDLLYIGLQVADGMTYLADRNVVHGHLSSSRVLLGPTFKVKIADCGLHRAFRANGEDTRRCQAPEAKDTGHCTLMSDVWSYGELLADLMAHRQQTAGSANAADLGIPAPLNNLIVKCRQVEAASRPRFRYVQAQIRYVIKNLEAILAANGDYVLPDPEPVSPDPYGQTLVALYEYMPVTRGDLRLRKGDRLVARGSSYENRVLVVCVRSDVQGHVPEAYVAPEGSLLAQDWFHGRIGTMAARSMLLDSGGDPGTFLVIDGEVKTSKGPKYILYVTCAGDDVSDKVKAYAILAQGHFVFIDARHKHPDLMALVAFLKDTEDHGLCCAVRTPCVKEPPDFLPPLGEETFEIPQASLVKEKLVGGGYFGDVYRGTWNNRVQVAIKVLKSEDPAKAREEFLKETKVLRALRHDKLLTMFGVCSDSLTIVTEFMAKGSLLQDLTARRLGTNRQGVEPLETHIFYAQQVVDAMSYLEEKEYIHRDLAARNILLGNNKTVKVADFGLARSLNSKQYYRATRPEVSYKWTALEGLNENSRFTMKSDVWSFGIVMVEIMTQGLEPYQGTRGPDMLDFLKNGGRHPIPERCSQVPGLDKLMQQCWAEDPDHRPTFAQLKVRFQGFAESTRGYLNLQPSA